MYTTNQTLEEGILDPLPRSFKEKFVNLRKNLGLKQYGKVLPVKLDIENIEKTGPNKLFDYHELLKDSRPRRSLIGGFNENTILLEGILSSLINTIKPKDKSLKIETYPAKQRQLEQIQKEKTKIKNQIAAIDLQKQVIDRVQPTKAEYDDHIRRYNSMIRANDHSNIGTPVIAKKIIPIDKNNPYNLNKQVYNYIKPNLEIRG